LEDDDDADMDAELDKSSEDPQEKEWVEAQKELKSAKSH
jgi:hypothetical protein